MSDLLVEVDEALKQERLEKLWKSYGGFFIGLLVMIVLGTAGNAGYHSWKLSKNNTQTHAYLEAVRDPQNMEQRLLDIAPTLNDSLRGLSKVQAAGMLVDQGKRDEARVIYQEIREDSTVSAPVRDLASYMVIILSEDMSAADKVQSLSTIAVDAENPWRYQAHFDAALINAATLKNVTKARQHFKVILDASDAPQSLQKKAQSLDILYAAQEKGASE